jgi:hypothetical protein
MLTQQHDDLLVFLNKRMGGAGNERDIQTFLDACNAQSDAKLTMEDFLQPLAEAGYIDNGGYAFRKSVNITRDGRDYIKSK